MTIKTMTSHARTVALPYVLIDLVLSQGNIHNLGISSDPGGHAPWLTRSQDSSFGLPNRGRL
jgi:hypothetical protein